MLEVLKLTHAYRDHVALEDVSFEIHERELVSIVGTSGCGKTTVLRAIAGLVQPTSGEMKLSGVPITGVPDGLAVVFQDYSRSLLPWMSVRDNVMFPLRRRGLGKAARRAAADGIASLRRTYPHAHPDRNPDDHT